MKLTFNRHTKKEYSMKATASKGQSSIWAELYAETMDILIGKEERVKEVLLESMPGANINISYFQNGEKIRKENVA